MRKYLFILNLIFASQIFAQTGIGTTTPNASAKLDVYATNKGFLPPRVTLTSATDVTTIASPAEGLLVYNLGSVGLQAGYYYWNGANWATIATATSAGNGVTASNLVNLYAKAYSTATGDIANSSGYSFTVPVSGRYLFDFSCTGFSNATITYKVRQGTTDLGTDAQTSINNTVHVEYNGKVEVNLQAGVTYNIYVTTTGNRDAGDYDRVYYKMVAGNLPVTGQSVDYVSVSRTGSDQTVNSGSTVVFNTINGGNIPYNTSTGAFSLTAGKTYRLSASISLSNGNSIVSECNVIWKTAAGDLLTNKAEVLSSSHSTNAVGNGNVSIIYTPTVNTTVSLYVTYSTSNALLWQTYTFASIEQIGSSAIIDPWILSGTNTYNTTGNVGIGNNAPTQALDVTGTGKFSTSIINSGTRTYFGKDGSNMHWFGTTDAIVETNNLGYGFESNGSSIQSHRWNIGGGEKMRINSSGNVGIGTSSPARKLHVQTSDQTSVYIESTTSDNNGMVILNANTNQNWANGWHEFLMFQNQGSTIGQVVQTNASTINYATTSDYRLKTDFKSFKGLDLVNKIKTYDYAWKLDSSRMYGVKAHELQLVLPYLVSGKKDEVDKDGKIIPQTVDYGKLTPVLVKAIQEQDSTIKSQTIEIQKLNKEKAILEKSIMDIKGRLLKLENKKN